MTFSELPEILGYTAKHPCAAISDINYFVRGEHYGRSKHAHDLYQYLIVTNGAVTLEYNGMQHTLKRGQVSLIPPHVLHVLYSEAGYSQVGINFRTDHDLAGLMPMIKTHIVTPVVTKDTRFLEHEKEIVQLIVTDSVVARSRACLLAGEALLNLVESVVYDQEGHFDTQLSFYLERHLGERLTAAQIAAHFHMSVPQLERLSRRYFASGVMALYQQKRLVKARVLLQDTDKSVSEIAQETGFYDAAHFSSFFAKRVGLSPSRWRRERNGVKTEP